MKMLIISLAYLCFLGACNPTGDGAGDTNPPPRSSGLTADEALLWETKVDKFDPQDIAGVEKGAKLVNATRAQIGALKAKNLGPRLIMAADKLALRVFNKAEELIEKNAQRVEKAQEKVTKDADELEKQVPNADQNAQEAAKAAQALASLKIMSPALKSRFELIDKRASKAKQGAMELANKLKAKAMEKAAEKIVDDLEADVEKYNKLAAEMSGSKDQNTYEEVLREADKLKNKLKKAEAKLLKKHQAGSELKIKTFEDLRELISMHEQIARAERDEIIKKKIPNIAKGNEEKLNKQLKLIEKLKPVAKVSPLTQCGQTCYMNSVLQALFHTRELNKLLQLPLEKIPFSPYVVPEETLLKILGEVFQSYTKDSGVIDTSPLAKVRAEFFRDKDGNPLFKENKQEDAQEFLSAFIDVLSEELNVADKLPSIELPSDFKFVEEAYQSGVGGHSYSLLSPWFRGFFESSFQPLGQPISRTYDPFAVLQLEIPEDKSKGVIRLEDLNKNFQKEETLLDIEGKKKITLQKAPLNLVVQLKRFKVDFEDGKAKSSRINTPVAYPLLWELATAEGEITYELYAVILQNGSLSGGHYTAHVKAGDQWYATDDEVKPRRMSAAAALNEPKASYLLFYRRVNN